MSFVKTNLVDSSVIAESVKVTDVPDPLHNGTFPPVPEPNISPPPEFANTNAVVAIFVVLSPTAWVVAITPSARIEVAVAVPVKFPVTFPIKLPSKLAIKVPTANVA